LGGRQLTHPDRRAECTALVALVPLAALIHAVGNLLREATFPWNGSAGLPRLGRNVLNMTESLGCRECPAFKSFCKGASGDAVRCHRLTPWLEALDGLALDMQLAPQPHFDLPLFFPQLLNGLEVPSVLARESAIAVGIAKALTSRGRLSRRAIPEAYAAHSLRAQWGIGEDTQLVCIGNYLDPYLEQLWKAQTAHEGREDVWGALQALGFDAATSLNFSIYLDRPRLEHLVNIKRTWLTVQRMQETSSLIPIPHLQWATTLDLERQLNYAQAQGFHTLTLNLQMWKRQGWDTVAARIPIIRERAPDVRLLITGVAGLKRIAELAEAFPNASFTNTAAHYLAQRYLRLRCDDTRLIKEPVEGHPDLILAENVCLFRGFLAGQRGDSSQATASSTPPHPSMSPIAETLHREFGFEPGTALDAEDLLATDEAILDTFQDWLDTGQLDRDFQGSFPTWPCADCVPNPSLGELLDAGADPTEAFLHLAHLAQRVDEEIQVFVGRAGH
jgi:hypothetical protein